MSSSDTSLYPAGPQARYGVGSRRSPSDLEWSRFRISAANLKRIERAESLVYLGRNGNGADVYDLVGTKYRMLYRAYGKPTRAGKFGQVHLAVKISDTQEAVARGGS